MRIEMKLLSVSLVAAATLGMVGCGGSDAPVAENPPAPVDTTPAYAKKVNMSVPMAKKALNLAYEWNAGLYDMIPDAASASKAEVKGAPSISKIPYIMLDFLRDFTYSYYGNEAKAGASRPDEENTTVTIDCAYEGSYTIHKELIFKEIDDIGTYSYLKEYTFDACEHNEPLEMNFEPHAAPVQYRFEYNGNLRFVLEDIEGDIDVEKVTLEANSFAFSLTENDKKMRDLNADFDGHFEVIDADRVQKYVLSLDGDVNAADYNVTSGEKTSSFVINTKAFNYSGADEDMIFFNLNIDGYAFLAPDMNASHARYLYGDGFKVAAKVEPEDVHLYNFRFDGTLGTPCFGGSVEFKTTAAWDVNTSMPDLDGNSGYPRTPYAGKTTIIGQEKSAEITFGKTADPKSWAQIGMVGETPEPKTTIDKIMDENCTFELF